VIEKLQLRWKYLALPFLVMFTTGFLILSACDESVEAPTIVVTEVVVVEGEQQVVTRIITQTVTVTPVPVVNMPASEPVVLDISFVSETHPDIDPQRTDDEDGIDLIENLFVGLTNYNHDTNQIEPELAYEWEIEDNGRIWTFYLRDDIFWIRPTEQDENGFWQVEPVRPVEAADFVFAIQRICNRETSTPNAFILFLIDGCEQVFQLEAATPADIEEIGVRALNETTLQVTLTKPATYFLTITSLWFFHPLPPELINEHEDDWQEPETLAAASSFMTSGPYFPVTREFRVLQRNPLWPIAYRGNVDFVEIRYLNTDKTAWQLWEAKTLDLVDATNLESDIYLDRIDTHARLVTNQTLFYLAFNFESGVFREPEVRRAFSAAIDREALVEELYGEQALECAMPFHPALLLPRRLIRLALDIVPIMLTNNWLKVAFVPVA
jgi:ABC-type oligopeptide transport system substrate-binding subunit